MYIQFKSIKGSKQKEKKHGWFYDKYTRNQGDDAVDPEEKVFFKGGGRYNKITPGSIKQTI